MIINIEINTDKALQAKLKLCYKMYLEYNQEYLISITNKRYYYQRANEYFNKIIVIQSLLKKGE